MTSLSPSRPGQRLYFSGCHSKQECLRPAARRKPQKTWLQSKKANWNKLSKNTRKKKSASFYQIPSVPSPPPWEQSRTQATAVTHPVPQLPRGSFHDTHTHTAPPCWAPGHSRWATLAVDKVTFTQKGTVESLFPELCHRGTATDVPHPWRMGITAWHLHKDNFCCSSERAMTQQKCVNEMLALTHAAHQRHQVSSVLRLAPKRGNHPRSWLRRVPGRAVVQVSSRHESERPKNEQHTLRFACLPACLTD